MNFGVTALAIALTATEVCAATTLDCVGVIDGVRHYATAELQPVDGRGYSKLDVTLHVRDVDSTCADYVSEVPAIEGGVKYVLSCDSSNSTIEDSDFFRLYRSDDGDWRLVRRWRVIGTFDFNYSCTAR